MEPNKLQDFYKLNGLSDGVKVEGITPDFIWYESEQITQSLSGLGYRIKRLAVVMEERHKEHLRMIDGLLHENKKLKEELNERT